jgi:hypothetical protein
MLSQLPCCNYLVVRVPRWPGLLFVAVCAGAPRPTAVSIDECVCSLPSRVLLAPIICNGADRKESGGPWIATVGIIRNGEQAGSGVYLKSGLIITAAHLAAIDATMSVRIAGVVLPAKVLKQGSAEDVDLSLLLVDEQKLPARLPRMQLCEAPPWPTDPVIIVDTRRASQSHIVSPQLLPYRGRTKFSI